MLLGDKFGVLAMWDRWSGLYKKTMEELGIGHKFVGVHSIDAPVDNRNLLSGQRRRDLRATRGGVLGADQRLRR